MKLLKPLFLFLLTCISLQTIAQNEILYGIVNNTLVEIDPVNATIVADIVPIDIGVDVPIAALEYLPDECTFYGIINAAAQPSLVSFGWTGQGQVIGEITVPSGEVYICEALVGLNEENMLLASVSLNGGVANGDYSSEAIIMIDPSNAVGTFVTQLSLGGTLQTDIDEMDLINDQLVIHDGQPNSSSYFYLQNYSSIPNPFNPSLFSPNGYHPVQGIACQGNLCYMPINDRRLMQLNLTNGDFDFLGYTHNSSDYEGDHIRAVEFVETVVPQQMLVDTTACEGSTLTLTTEEGVESPIWNTGEFSNSIEVDADGQFFYQGYDGSCPILSDIFNVTFVECTPCADILMEIEDELDLGNDTLLCDNETLSLQINLDDSYQVLWNNGATDNPLIISEAGTYAALISTEDCDFQTTTITVSFEDCDPCEDILDNIAEQLQLGNDTLLCEGESLSLQVDLDDSYQFLWSDGSTNNPIIITDGGTYSATVSTPECDFETSTIIVSFEDCDPCEDIFIAIEPQLNLGNDTLLCLDDSLAISLNLDDSFDIIWSNGETGNTLTVYETGAYFATISTPECSFTTSIINVNFEFCDPCEPLLAEIQQDLFIGEDTLLCSFNQLTLAVNLDTDFDYSIDWNTGLSSNPLPVNESGTYQANIQIAECTFQTNVVTVIFNECKNCEYYVPNSFSPNDDGFNDIYQIFFDESNCIISDFKMQVYNRWGGLIHESEQNQWNGRLNGEFLNNGVYLVCMEFTMEQEGQIVDKRECVAVNLLR